MAERYWRLDGEDVCAVFTRTSGAPGLIYLGAPLDPAEDLDAIATASARGRHESQADAPPPLSLLPVGGTGFLGTPALEILADGRGVTLDPVLTDIRQDAGEIAFTLKDARTGAEIELTWCRASAGILVASASLRNGGDMPLTVARLASLALPLPGWVSHVTRYSGRWAGEMRSETLPIPRAALAHDSRGGRPGFGGGNWLLAHEADAGMEHGRILGLHLAWSGDHASLVEGDADGRGRVLLGCRLDIGEIVLAPGESFDVPEVHIGFSDRGRNGLRHAMTGHVRHAVLPGRADWPPRRVHLNSWEALGFDMDEAKLMRLADDAAAIGIERFVVDDGWFGSRRDDRTSLGDWTVSPDLFPDGLDPLIAHVEKLGMDFGLWVEPEMVSPDSDLYRAHPDWCIHKPGADRPTQRGQLVLDLMRAEVADHVLCALDALLSAHRIAYLKWDHNRDLFPRTLKGHAQTLALYALIDRLRAVHPAVEIESCASGGGRIDYAMLSRCHRVWASDNNDPIERLRINTGWGPFLPLEVTGNHVGPSPNPVTGRRTEMDFRAKVAMFGHMGVEADPAAMTEEERASLAAHLALYKAWRGVLHGGDSYALDLREPGLFGQIAVDGEKALAIVARTDFAADFNAERVRLCGLDPAAIYRVRLIEPWPPKARHYLPDRDRWRDGLLLSGAYLAREGLALPLVHPETAWLIGIEKQ
ncbi:alpha-galactosidase [Parasphingopyxis algicola]|uniref:alpha-galactosidase n=1 Tax=Parasphingopyxis algicola TaxID=2026624 RepID=UPI0015A43072|nr:alpha-galactosidase [Parasphingopyxis algicola]QLC25370.1 alpha-galactosidase [Parasphingopyxis algicola]